MVKRLEEPLVSVVVPVYNSEKYLGESIGSIVAQSYTKLQIIFVDDGATDKSPDILKMWQERDKRILVISQENRGAGAARNAGMQAATGKYIMFLDADDVFHKNMIKSLVATAQKQSTDVILFGYYTFDGIRKEKMINSAKILHVPFNKIISPADICDDLFQTDHGMPWNKFYDLQFLKNKAVYFQELHNTNDEYFSRLSVAEAKRMLVMNKIFVVYRINNSESLQGKEGSKSEDFKKALIAIHDELKKRGYYDLYKVTYQKLVYYMVLGKVQEVSGTDTFGKWLASSGNEFARICEIDLDLICKIINEQ